MKRLLFALLFLSAFAIHSQKYEIGAMDANGFAFKINGTVEFTDSMMLMQLDSKDGLKRIDYDIVNQRNGITYVSDGTETFNTTIIEREGKRKGYKHTHILSFTHPAGQVILYYLNPM